MNAVDVVDRGGQEITIYLSGRIDETLSEELDEAIDEVAGLERIHGLGQAIVDMHLVTELDNAGLAFLEKLTERGHTAGFDVSFSTMTGAAHRAVEAAGWRFMEASPPLPPR
ncbi:STAS domain-containing protein [Actinobacteria bacterium YIM 96077]|uniref:STAS domain-containing protein n=1 Tax=Phytoactinopolyspora halophila TaxID=1981511 RepID=A0A329R0B2_9ACTN|nr:STAS domain-containing protein [Phytoactinopolyspora halophila]AYY11482.1 STAS domain-containing protein [Actinobacteria bacterium YIM 96077]RAW18035.1 hypothetical protein DPM12_04180 [Phytoactinopolyspora halophila]